MRDGPPAQALTAQPSARQLLSVNVRRLRLERGLSQERLAERSGVHINTVSTLERGVLNASVDLLERIAQALGVPLYTLLVPFDAPPPPEGDARP